MHDQACLEVLRSDLPQFLDTQTVMLRVAVPVQLVAFDELPAQVPPAALRKNCVPGAQFHTRFKAILMLPRCGYAHISRCNACHASCFVKEDFSGRETGIYLNLQRLRLLRQPTANIPQADDIITPVMHARRYEGSGNPDGGFFAGQEIHKVLTDWCI